MTKIARSSYLIRFLNRNSIFSGESEFLLAVICISAPSASMCCSTLAMFFVSSIPRWWLPTTGIRSSLIMVIIPVACPPKPDKHIIKNDSKNHKEMVSLRCQVRNIVSLFGFFNISLDSELTRHQSEIKFYFFSPFFLSPHIMLLDNNLRYSS